MTSFFTRLFSLLKQRQGDRSYILRGSAGLFATNVLGLAISFVVQVVIARSAGSAAYGVYAIVLSWLAILLQPARFGMELTALRFASFYRVEEKWGLLNGLIRRSTGLVGLVSLVISALAVVGVLLAREFGELSSTMSVALVLGFALLPIIATNDIDASILRGMRRPVLSSVLSTVIRPFLTGLLVIAYVMSVDERVSPEYCILAYGIAYLIVRIISRIYVRLSVSQVTSAPSEREYLTREWVSVAMPLLFTAGFVIILRKVDTIMVGSFIGEAEAGYYSAASRLVDLTNMGLAATYLVIAPLIAERYSSRDRDGLQQILGFSMKVILVITIPIVVGLVILAVPLLSIFGAEFVIARNTMLVLIGGQLIATLTGCVGYLMTMSDNQVTAAKIWGGCAALNLFLNYTMIPILGMAGAAMATAISIGVANIALLLVVRRRLEVDPSIALFVARSSGT